MTVEDRDLRSIIEEVRERTDLAQLVGETILLEVSGSVLRGRSPIHRDRDPSLVVWPHTQTWRDFSGGGSIGGDCFDFLEYRDGLAFMDALKLLAARAGVALPGNGGAPAAFREAAQEHRARRRLQSLLTAAATYYHSMLPPAIRRSWLHDRYGFNDEIIDALLIGWSDGRLFEHITRRLGASHEEALATGLFVRLRDGRVKDFFVKRLVFPYWKNGRVVYFIARATDHTSTEPWEKPKYKKLPTRSKRHPYVSPLIANDTFYNEDSVRGPAELLITEGITDCISAMQCGVACISPGTVQFRRRDHARLVELTRRVGRVIICNDAEESGAGAVGAEETARVLFDAGRDVRLAAIPRPEGIDKIDLNELVKARGAESLMHVMQDARRLPEYLLEQIPEDTLKADLDKRLEPVLALIRNSPPLHQEAYTDLLRKRFHLKAATIRALLHPPRSSAATEGASGDGNTTQGRSLRGGAPLLHSRPRERAHHHLLVPSPADLPHRARRRCRRDHRRQRGH